MSIRQWVWNPPADGPKFRSTIFDGRVMTGHRAEGEQESGLIGDALPPEVLRAVAPDVGAVVIGLNVDLTTVEPQYTILPSIEG